MIWDFRPGRNRFAGIALQEYSGDLRSLVGQAPHYFRGHALGFTGGPHLYKRNGFTTCSRPKAARVGTRGHLGAIARTDGAVCVAPGRPHPHLRGTDRMWSCSAPGTQTSSRLRWVRPTWCTSAGGRSATGADQQYGLFAFLRSSFSYVYAAKLPREQSGSARHRINHEISHDRRRFSFSPDALLRMWFSSDSSGSAALPFPSRR